MKQPIEKEVGIVVDETYPLTNGKRTTHEWTVLTDGEYEREVALDCGELCNVLTIAGARKLARLLNKAADRAEKEQKKLDAEGWD